MFLPFPGLLRLYLGSIIYFIGHKAYRLGTFAHLYLVITLFWQVCWLRALWLIWLKGHRSNMLDAFTYFSSLIWRHMETNYVISTTIIIWWWCWGHNVHTPYWMCFQETRSNRGYLSSGHWKQHITLFSLFTFECRPCYLPSSCPCTYLSFS